MASEIDLAGQLAAGHKRLAELIAENESQTSEARKLQAELAAAELADKDEREQAMIDGREPSQKVAKVIDTLTSRLHAVQARQQTAAGAAARQRAAVDQLQSEIDARRHETRVTGMVPPEHEIVRRIFSTVEAIERQENVRQGEYVQISELLPDVDPRIREFICRIQGHIANEWARLKADFEPSYLDGQVKRAA